MIIVNKVAIASFLREQGIPAGEAIFAAVILGDKGIDAKATADAFADGQAEHFDAVHDALIDAQARVQLRRQEAGLAV